MIELFAGVVFKLLLLKQSLASIFIVVLSAIIVSYAYCASYCYRANRDRILAMVVM